MTTFLDHQHPRANDGRFTAKDHPEAQPELAAPAIALSEATRVWGPLFHDIDSRPGYEYTPSERAAEANMLSTRDRMSGNDAAWRRPDPLSSAQLSSESFDGFFYDDGHKNYRRERHLGPPRRLEDAVESYQRHGILLHRGPGGWNTATTPRRRGAFLLRRPCRRACLRHPAPEGYPGPQAASVCPHPGRREPDGPVLRTRPGASMKRGAEDHRADRQGARAFGGVRAPVEPGAGEACDARRETPPQLRELAWCDDASEPSLLTHCARRLVRASGPIAPANDSAVVTLPHPVAAV